MSLFLLITCALLLLLTAVIFARSLFLRNWDLLSWRNLFLVGYAHFVLLSGYFTVAYGWGTSRRGVITNTSTLYYAILVPLFFFLFLWTCGWAARRGWFVRFIPRLELPITTPGLLSCITILLTLALVMTVMPLPSYLAVLGSQFRTGMATVAVGLATYWALCHRFNPASWLLLFGAVSTALVISVVGSMGRRDPIAVLVAIPWMWYYIVLRYRSSASVAIFTGSLLGAAVLVIAAYTVVRAEGIRENTGPGAGQRIEHLLEVAKNPTITSGAVENMLYTDTAANTMFILNNYPTNYPYMPFHAAHWILVNPIPRAIYPAKPEAYGIILRDQMRDEANLGPGIIGQAWSEGGLLAIILFAVFFGVVYGTADAAIRQRCWNPYFVALAGCGAGNVLAMPRGDIALFTIQIIAATLSTAAVLAVINVVLGPVVRAFPELLPPRTGRDLHEAIDEAANEEGFSELEGDEPEYQTPR